MVPPAPLLDGAAADIDGLVAVQGNMMRNYFRLLRIHEELERRLRRSGNGAAAIELIESERARLAHELHSGAGQALAGIKIHLELLASYLEAPAEPVRSSLDRIGLLTQEALDQVRNIARRIHPPDWENLTLAEALRRLWETSGIPGRFDAALDVSGLSVEPPHHIRVLLYRVAQEALTNAIRHAAARRLRLTLAGDGASLRLIVEDDGRGFDLASTLACGTASRGIGLQSMRDQVRWAGGELRIESGSRGTRVTVCLPLPKRS